MINAPFHPTAHLYDLVYGHLDYPEHAAVIEGVIRTEHPGADSLLDVGCGTGKHLEIWQHRFARVAGLDLDAGLLAVAAARLPGVPLHEADMTEFDLGRRFDAVTCLFSAIGYVLTPERLDAAVAAMARHLEPGGVLVIEPWLWPSQIATPHRLRIHVAEDADTIVARTTRWRNPDTWAEDGVSRMEFAYLVTTAAGSELLVEQHDMGLFTPDRYLAALEAAGLQARFDPVGTRLERGLAIGVRRLS